MTDRQTVNSSTRYGRSVKSLGDVLRSILAHWRLIGTGALIGVIAGASLGLLQKPIYTATSQCYLFAQTASNVSDLSQGAAYAGQVVKSLATIATSPLILDKVRSELDLPENASVLAQMTTVDIPIDTTVLSIRVESHSASNSARIANAIAAQLEAQAPILGPSTTSARGAIQVTQTAIAGVPTQPSAPNTPLIILIGLLLGFAAGVAGAVLLERLNTRLRSADQLRTEFDLPMIGQTPFSANWSIPPAHMQASPTSLEAEAIRAVRANLEFISVDQSLKTIVISSSIAAEGKSSVASALAVSVAQGGASTIIVDPDLRRPAVAGYFGIDDGLGLTDVLAGKASIDNAIQSWGTDGVDVLPAGTMSPNPGELVRSAAMVELLAQLGQRYSMVLIDSPPVLPVSDAAAIGQHTDGIILVCAQDRVRTAQIDETLGQLRLAGTNILGLLLTFSTRAADRYYQYESVADEPTTVRDKSVHVGNKKAHR